MAAVSPISGLELVPRPVEHDADAAPSEGGVRRRDAANAARAALEAADAADEALAAAPVAPRAAAAPEGMFKKLAKAAAAGAVAGAVLAGRSLVAGAVVGAAMAGAARLVVPRVARAVRPVVSRAVRQVVVTVGRAVLNVGKRVAATALTPLRGPYDLMRGRLRDGALETLIGTTGFNLACRRVGMSGLVRQLTVKGFFTAQIFASAAAHVLKSAVAAGEGNTQQAKISAVHAAVGAIGALWVAFGVSIDRLASMQTNIGGVMGAYMVYTGLQAIRDGRLIEGAQRLLYAVIPLANLSASVSQPLPTIRMLTGPEWEAQLNNGNMYYV